MAFKNIEIIVTKCREVEERKKERGPEVNNKHPDFVTKNTLTLNYTLHVPHHRNSTVSKINSSNDSTDDDSYKKSKSKKDPTLKK